jgi:hypothetical protein
MLRRSAIIAAIFTILAVALTGCAPMSITGSAKIDQGAFNKKKKFAVITIAAAKEFRGEKGMTQMFKDTDEIPGANTQPIIDKLTPEIRSKFAKTKHFTSMPKKRIVGSRAYKKMAEDERVQKVLFMKVPINVASGYKYVSDSKKMAQLAKDLKVDGVIGVFMSFTVMSMKSGVHIAGIQLGKKEYASTAAISVIAYDQNGKQIWKDSTVKTAEPGDKKAIVIMDFSDITKTNFEKLHPSAVYIGKHAIDVLLERFNDTMAGKKTSIFQKMKEKKKSK